MLAERQNTRLFRILQLLFDDLTARLVARLCVSHGGLVGFSRRSEECPTATSTSFWAAKKNLFTYNQARAQPD